MVICFALPAKLIPRSIAPPRKLPRTTASAARMLKPMPLFCFSRHTPLPVESMSDRHDVSASRYRDSREHNCQYRQRFYGQVRQLPGAAFVTSTAIMDNEVHVLQSDKPLQNFVVSGRLFQIAAHDPSYDAEDSRADRPQHRRVKRHNRSRRRHELHAAEDPVDAAMNW